MRIAGSFPTPHCCATVWAAEIVDFLKEYPSPGRALTHAEETALLDTASKSRCRSLYAVIMLAINTGIRANEIRGLTWAQVDFLANALTVGKSKTAAGTGRMIPLNPRAAAVLTHWRGLFSGAQPEDYVFPHEKYGLAGNDRKLCAYEIVPAEPMHRWKVAWERTQDGKRLLPLPRSASYVHFAAGRAPGFRLNSNGSRRARLPRHDGTLFAHPHGSEA
jgi:integrase